MEDSILKEITDFYIGSADYNGIPIHRLKDFSKIQFDELKNLLVKLVKEEKITLTFSTISANPHIKRFPDLRIEDQLKWIDKEDPNQICAYPSRSIIERSIDVSEYNDRPFTKRLLLGEAQLFPLYFDLIVLERYFNDPRYIIRFYGYGGEIHLSDDYRDSEYIHFKDNVFIKSFGLGYNEKKNRVVVVYLYDLARLTAKHQMLWMANLREERCTMVQDFYRSTIMGEFPINYSIYEAFLEEQAIINEMSGIMGFPPFFLNLYNDSPPREFSFFLRPTKKNYLSFIHLLDKMISDNINKKFFEKFVRLEDSKNPDLKLREKGTIVILERWLRTRIKVDNEDVFAEIIEPIKKLRRDRQQNAHLIIEDEYDPEYYDLQDKTITIVYNSIRMIRLLFANHPTLKDYRVPDWLYQGKNFVNY